MRLFHSVTATVFAKEADNLILLEQKIRAFFPFVLEKEKLRLNKQNATGFNDRRITIYEVILEKEAHINQFVEWLMKTLNKDQKAMLLRQLDSRLDQELGFYLRFDKKAWNEEERLFFVDHGDCYHFKLRVAAYPKNRQVAMAILTKMLSA